ncbi:MAG: 5-formyltetrahydrofolate cyclo-ligase [Rhodocyclales bacterium RIFCSPLOWO2_02_FULL_63_24]|nr:MAG: 5-formyltetrahydrofolate cyclo-ligase [Rhodocyclales bacterium GWA2_65_19]OHC72494.1 MAG: 5-formyltetrahydrofolate cyclo-ligase [Rhodocyclales bacterium RIFCSPLOWO2_02_FULL_63_24]
MTAPSPSDEHTVDSSVFRATLRHEKLAARSALDEKVRHALALRIEAHLEALLLPYPPQTLAFCAPVRGEFDARPLVSRLIERGWRAAMPIVEVADAPMIFRIWIPSSAMDIDRHGIPVPLGGAKISPDIVLLPLVAFDRNGFRIGYGGGYFDRTLAALVPRPLAIGVGFELGRVADILPQAHDLPLDAIVTEAGIMRHT